MNTNHINLEKIRIKILTSKRGKTIDNIFRERVQKQ